LLRDLREGLARHRHGRMPGEVMEAIQRAARARAPWQALLARCVGGIRRDDYRLLPPSRRHLWRGIMLPSLGVPGPRSIVCAIDTSGSIDRALASRFLAEVHALRSSAQCRLHVIQCDAGIREHRVFEGWEAPPRDDGKEAFKGRGGTDFRPVFDLVAREIVPSEGPPDLLAYMTDGFGTFPQAPPRWPVVWLLPEGSRAATPFGQRIEVPPR
jgi:predicted metal-dependent peptidase